MVRRVDNVLVVGAVWVATDPFAEATIVPRMIVWRRSHTHVERIVGKRLQDTKSVSDADAASVIRSHTSILTVPEVTVGMRCRRWASTLTVAMPLNSDEPSLADSLRALSRTSLGISISSPAP